MTKGMDFDTNTMDSVLNMGVDHKVASIKCILA